MLLGLQKRHDFLETLTALQIGIHDGIRLAAALLLLKILEFISELIVPVLELRHVSHDLGDLGIDCFS